MAQSSFRGVVTGDPANKTEGDWWYDTVDNQYKGFDGTINVLLG